MVDIELLSVGDIVKVVDRKTSKFAFGQVSFKTDNGVSVRLGFDENCIVTLCDDRYYIDCLLEKV
jgi:hypothetical protein